MTGKGEFQAIARSLAHEIAREPRARATVRIGGVGRRKLDAAVTDQLHATVEKILSRLASDCEALLAQEHIAGKFLPELDLVAISPCAEGADQIVMGAALESPHGYRLGVITPFDLADYRSTFNLEDKQASLDRLDRYLQMAQAPSGFGVLVLDGKLEPAFNRDSAYAQCGNLVTHRSDALIAILEDDAWYSLTGQAVREAVNDGVPVIAIDPRSPGDYRVLAPAVFDKGIQPGTDEALKKLAAHLLMSGGSLARAKQKRAYGFSQFVAEDVVCLDRPNLELSQLDVYRVVPAPKSFVCALSGINAWVERRMEKALNKPKSQFRPAPVSDLALSAQDWHAYAEICLRQHRADVIASSYAELHRSVFYVVAVVGTFAVIFAACGTQFGWPWLWSSLEAVFVIAAVGLVTIANRGAWLDRWMDCRLIAEILRYSRFLVLTGQSSPLARYEPVPDVLSEGNAWAAHYTQIVLRAHGLSVPGRGVQQSGDALQRIMAFIDHNCVANQIDYHLRTGSLRNQLGHILKIVSHGLGALTVVAVCAKWGLDCWARLPAPFLRMPEIFEWAHKPLEIAAICLPAITAGVFALQTFGEHDLVSSRSQRMVLELGWAREKLRASQSIYDLGMEAARITHILLRHVDGWREIFAGKHIHSG